MYQLRPMTEEYLDLVLEWRNKPEIRNNMYTTHIITRDEHYSWFEKIKQDISKRYLICTYLDQPVGVVNFIDINPVHKTAMWAFYSGNTSKRGVGSWMEFLALNYAFEELLLEKLNCEVLSFNYPVVSLHRKFGFKIEGIFKHHYLKGDQYSDIYRLAIFKRDWINHLQSEFQNKLSHENKSRKNNMLEVGSRHKVSFMITIEQIKEFAKVTGDVNSIHLDESEAKKRGFPSVISHGFLSGSIFSKILGIEFPGNGTVYKKQSLVFKKPVFPNQKLTASLKVVTKIGRNLIIETVITDSSGSPLVEGEAEVILSRGENDS